MRASGTYWQPTLRCYKAHQAEWGESRLAAIGHLQRCHRPHLCYRHRNEIPTGKHFLFCVMPRLNRPSRLFRLIWPVALLFSGLSTEAI